VNARQWNQLFNLVEKGTSDQVLSAFIIDSPWLPNWAGLSIMDYFASDELWFEANRKAIDTFPETIFIPGFWAEYGMCSEPSAFGSKCIFPEDEFPFADKVITSADDVSSLSIPNVKKDGLLPFMVKRLKLNQVRINDMGHVIKMAVSRGPLNIAAHLMGTTEFLMEIKTNPDIAHLLIKKITAFTKEWLEYQREQFPSIEGVLILDDIVGFLGKDDFLEFAFPYLKEIFQSIGPSINIFHNDAAGLVSAPFLSDAGIHIFNLGIKHSLTEIRQAAGARLVLMGNVPPRTALAEGTVADVVQAVGELRPIAEEDKYVLLSCGGGVPPGVSTQNLKAFLQSCLLSSASHSA
jgi:uroporphyrinogen-III decarboxylase